MIAGSEDIDAGSPHLRQSLFRKTYPMGKIFRVGDDQIGMIAPFQFRQFLDHGAPSDLADDVGNKNNLYHILTM